MGAEIAIGGEPVAILVVRRGALVAAYRNDCPHRGLPLDFMPGRFLDRDRQHILCINHGALFRMEDGLCVAGPCITARLRPVPVEVVEGDVVLAQLDARAAAVPDASAAAGGGR